VSNRIDIPTRQEHHDSIKKVFYVFNVIALVCFLVMSGTAGIMRLNGSEWKDVASIMLVMVYIALPVYLFGYIAPMVMASFMKMSRGLDISSNTAEDMCEVKRDVKPIISDVQKVASDVQPAVAEVRKAVEEGKKLFDSALGELRNGNGNLENKVSDILKKAIAEARNTVKGAEGDFEKLIWDKVDRFLATVFGGKEETPSEGVKEQEPEEEKAEV
jgi:hypothetical protein